MSSFFVVSFVFCGGVRVVCFSVLSIFPCSVVRFSVFFFFRVVRFFRGVRRFRGVVLPFRGVLRFRGARLAATIVMDTHVVRSMLWSRRLMCRRDCENVE